MIRDVAIYLLNHVAMDDSGWERFEHSCDLLSDEVPQMPTGGGVYILMSERTLFTYPAGASSVFYIGMAMNLKSRLLDHRKFSRQVKNGEAATRYFPRYEWAANHGAIATYAVRPRKNSTMTPKDIESLLLAKFGEAFRAPPLANSQSAWDQR